MSGTIRMAHDSTLEMEMSIAELEHNRVHPRPREASP